MASYGITAHLICQSFNDVFSKYGDKTPLFDNMHITAAFATSEPTSIEKVTRRAGKALELRDSYSDPRTIFGRAHRSTSQSEQQRYILSEEDVRGLDDRKQFLFVNNTKPILADKIRYYEEPFFKARNSVPAMRTCQGRRTSIGWGCSPWGLPRRRSRGSGRRAPGVWTAIQVRSIRRTTWPHRRTTRTGIIPPTTAWRRRRR